MTAKRQKAAAAVKAAIAEIDAEARRIRSDADERVAGLRAEREELERGLRVLGKNPAPRKPVKDHRAIAGPAAIDAVEKFLRRRGKAFQSDITKATGLNSGTVTHALLALAADTKIATTGEVRRRSPEYAFIGLREKERETVTA